MSLPYLSIVRCPWPCLGGEPLASYVVKNTSLTNPQCIFISATGSAHLKHNDAGEVCSPRGWEHSLPPPPIPHPAFFGISILHPSSLSLLPLLFSPLRCRWLGYTCSDAFLEGSMTRTCPQSREAARLPTRHAASFSLTSLNGDVPFKSSVVRLCEHAHLSWWVAGLHSSGV